MTDPDAGYHVFVALTLAMVTGLSGARVSLAMHSGQIRVWNSIRLDRRSAPRRFWAWIVMLTGLALGATLVLLALAASAFLPSLDAFSRRALDAAGMLLLV